MMTAATGAVFFLGSSRSQYESLEQPNYDVENGNTSTESIYHNQSIEELWPNEKANQHGEFDTNYNTDPLSWNYNEQNNSVVQDEKVLNCVKRRVKRHSSQTLLCDEKPAILNNVEQKEDLSKTKSRGGILLSFLASFARRKRNDDFEEVEYLQHFDSALNSCTYRESCRCLDCQSRYFECEDDSDAYSSDDDYSPYSIQEMENQVVLDLDDDVFINSTHDNDNTSTDLLLDDQQEEEQSVQEILGDDEADKQMQMEVAASTSAMFNILIYHPFTCCVQ